jgi:hypothetical protein
MRIFSLIYFISIVTSYIIILVFGFNYFGLPFYLVLVVTFVLVITLGIGSLKKGKEFDELGSQWSVISVIFSTLFFAYSWTMAIIFGPIIALTLSN